MKRRFLLSAVALFALSVVATTNSARANLFGCPGCCEAPKCCAKPPRRASRPAVVPRRVLRRVPSPPLGAAEEPNWPAAILAARRAAAPRLAAKPRRPAPRLCEAPKCCEPACGCVPKSCRPCLLERLKAKLACCHPCCEKSCCAPACCEAPKACAAPAALPGAALRPACGPQGCEPRLAVRVRPEVPSLPLGRTEGQAGLLPSLLREELLRSGLLRSPQGLRSAAVAKPPRLRAGLRWCCTERCHRHLLAELKAKLACCQPCCEKSCCAPNCCEAPRLVLLRPVLRPGLLQVIDRSRGLRTFTIRTESSPLR